ncbi:MAG: hypothetical protein JKX71_07560 [Amylibacter sp.]|nr:hypothetical protein [Amylibacter sp.]
MATIKHIQMRKIYTLFNLGSGCVLDFSNRSFAEFFTDEIGVDIYSTRFSDTGESNAKRLSSFIKQASFSQVSQILKALWEIQNESTEEEIENHLELCAIGAVDIEYHELKFMDYHSQKSKFWELLDEIEQTNKITVTENLHSISKIINFHTCVDAPVFARSFLSDWYD